MFKQPCTATARASLERALSVHAVVAAEGDWGTPYPGHAAGVGDGYAAWLHVEYRGHSLRVLLGYLAQVLRERGFERQAEEVAGFARAWRRLLSELEEAHVRAVYGALEYSEGQARLLLEAAKRVAGLVERVRREVLPPP